MRSARSPRITSRAQLVLGSILTALALGAQSGCTREFYREWCNQDVSEAVFEKTRDPRWRMDVFSIEPPALSRYADPYDQDVPPAPPDDPASEALSPVPQWPDNRLLVPVEGTGYLDLLEYWKRDRDARSAAAGHPVPAYQPEYWQRPDRGHHPVTDSRQPGMSGQPLTSPVGPPVPPVTGSPFSNPNQPMQPGGVAPQPGGVAPTPPGGAAPPPTSPPTPPPNAPPTGPQALLNRRVSDPLNNASVTIVRMQSGDEPPSGAQAGSSPLARSASERSFKVSNPQAVAKFRDTRLGFDAHTSNERGHGGHEEENPSPTLWFQLHKLPGQRDRAPTDRSVSQASFPQNGLPATASDSGMRTEVLQMVGLLQNQPTTVPAQPRPASDPSQEKPPAATPSNILDREIATQPPMLNERQIQEIGDANRVTPAEAAQLTDIFVPRMLLEGDTEAYGYPKGSRVYQDQYAAGIVACNHECSILSVQSRERFTWRRSR